jgi:hypothetical protein
MKTETSNPSVQSAAQPSVQTAELTPHTSMADTLTITDNRTEEDDLPIQDGRFAR